MNGFNDIVNGFSLEAIQALQVEASEIYMGWQGEPLPDVPFDVTDYGLVGDGSDDTAALEALALNTGVTNWYFPSGTYLLYKVTIPSHVEAVYGDGATSIIESKANADGGGAQGAIILGSTTKLIIDGLHFTQEVGTWGDTQYGHITAYGGVDLANMEIRNCSFEIPVSTMRAIKLHAGQYSDGTITNLHVHNNTFTDFNDMCLEITGGTTVIEDRCMTNIHIHDNSFIGQTADYTISLVNAWGGVGLTGVPDGDESTIYNNTFTNVSSAIEIGKGSGVRVHHNYGTGISSTFVEFVSNYTEGQNFCYANHMEGSLSTTKLHIYLQAKVEYYENYFKRSRIDFSSEDGLTDVNVHDNTFVYDIGSESVSWAASPANDGSQIFEDNEFYSSVNVSNYFYFNASNGGTNIEVRNNIFNMVNPSGIAINNNNGGDPIIDTGNTITLDYQGTFPTSRPGAGLLP